MNAAAEKASTSSRLRSHFELFDLDPAYAIDSAALDQSYRDLQALVHPDRYASAGDAERRASMQLTTRVNEAYRALKDPVQRAKHILELNGVDVAFETNTQMPTDFLMQQLEMREELEASIGESIDARKDYAGAVELVRKLLFLRKIEDEIQSAYEAIE